MTCSGCQAASNPPYQSISRRSFVGSVCVAKREAYAPEHSEMKLEVNSGSGRGHSASGALAGEQLEMFGRPQSEAACQGLAWDRALFLWCREEGRCSFSVGWLSSCWKSSGLRSWCWEQGCTSIMRVGTTVGRKLGFVVSTKQWFFDFLQNAFLT